MELKEKVLAEIKRLNGNARFPSVLDICYEGKETETAERLGVGRNDTDNVLAAVKRLHEEGKIKFVFRYGYTWVVPASFRENPNEIIDTPTDTPYNWKQL